MAKPVVDKNDCTDLVGDVKPMGRPSTFSQAVADDICERIALGSGDGGFIGSVIAQGIGELLTQVGLTGLEAGDHADDAIEQGSHGSQGIEKEMEETEAHGTPRGKGKGAVPPQRRGGVRPLTANEAR